MEGLLERAKQFRKRLGMEQSATHSLDGLSEEEREEVSRTMDAVLNHNRMNVQPDRFTIKAKKRGFLLPVLVNLVALAIIGVGILLFSRLFTLQGEADTKRLQTVTSGEGLLLETLRKEAAENIASKNREIMDIQGRLESVAKEREKLSAGLESRLAEKEALMRKDLEDELARERKRLVASGLSEAEITSRMDNVKKQSEEKARQELLEYRSRMDQEIKNLEADMSKREGEYQTLLDSARQDRNRLQKESQDRIKSMQDQMDAKDAENKKALGQADERLKTAQDEMKRLADQRARQTRFDEQIQSWYQRIRQDLESKNYEALGTTLDHFDSFLGTGDLGDALDLTRRRDVERFFSSLVRELAEMRKRDAKTRGILEDSWIVEKTRALYAKARDAQARGDLAETYRVYRDLMQVMPETAEAWMSLSAHQKAEDALAMAKAQSSPSPSPSASPGIQDGQTFALVRSALEAPDWEAQKQKVLAEASAVLEAQTRVLTQENQELRNRVKDLGLRVSGLDQDKRTLQEDKRTLQGQSRTDRTAWEQEKALLEAQISLRVAEVARFRESVDQGAALLQARQQELDAAAGRISSLEGLNAETVARLQAMTSQNRELEDKARSLGGQVEALGAQVGNLESRLGEMDARLRRALAATPVPPSPVPTSPAPRPASPSPSPTPAPVDQSALLAAAKAENDRLSASYRQLQADLDRTAKELDVSRTELKAQSQVVVSKEVVDLQQAEAAWTAYAGQVSLDSLKSGTSTLQARLKLDAFLALPEMNALFPGLYQHVKEYNRLFEESGSRTLLVQLSDLIYSAGSYAEPAERKAFLAGQTGKQDSAEYRELLQLIADLMD